MLFFANHIDKLNTTKSTQKYYSHLKSIINNFYNYMPKLRLSTPPYISRLSRELRIVVFPANLRQIAKGEMADTKLYMTTNNAVIQPSRMALA